MNAPTDTDAPTIVPPSEADQAIAGWKFQRRAVARERAESAAWAEAIATGRTIRGGTYTVTLPRDLSRQADAPGCVLNAAGCEMVTVDLGAVHSDGKRPGRAAHVADPRAGTRWTWARLASAAMREAEAARRTIRPRPSTEAAEDAAQGVIADILSRTAGTLPTTEQWTRDRLRIAIRRDLIDATREDRNVGEDADAEIGDDLPAAQAASELRRAQRDRDPMLRPWADPLSREAHDIADAADLGERARDAIAADAYGLRAPDIAEYRQARPDTIRQRVKRGRADIAEAAPDADARDAIRAAAAATVEERRHGAAAILKRTIGQAERATRNRPTLNPPERMPARNPDAPDGWHEVGHAPVHVRRAEPTPTT